MNYSFEFEHQRAARKKIIIRVAIIIVEVIVVILAAFLLTHKGMVVFTVSGQDMAPTLNNGDRILINKLSYRIHSIKRNDIVVVKQSGAEHNYFSVERVIGLPGEKVQIINGEVYIDDEKYEEKYNAATAKKALKKKRIKIITITASAIAVTISTFFVLLGTVITPLIKYNQAMSFIRSGDYDSAQQILENLHIIRYIWLEDF